MNPFGVKIPWRANEAIVEQEVVAESDFISQFLKMKLKPNTKLVPEISTLNITIKIYL